MDLEVSNSYHQQGVGIVGAGLVGCLAALAFNAKGFSVTLFEYRDDPSKTKNDNLRSINLAVSARGIRALKYVDEEMAERILEHIIPMKGRMIHDLDGNQTSQLYGLFGEAINSIDRSFLNECLLEEIRHTDIKVLFNHKLVAFEKNHGEDQTPKMTFIDTSEGDAASKTFEFDYIVGADGAHSQFRTQLQRTMRMNYSQEYIDMQYIELYIPPSESAKDDSKFLLNPNHLHIWPRTNHMLIALANKDGSFTCTFFSPWSVIEGITSTEQWISFFKKNFKDAYDLIGEARLATVYETHPRGSLLQVNVYPYHSPDGRAILLGDAAHSMVPFYGQGMNCGFEDVRTLMELIDEKGGDVLEAFRSYTEIRKADLDAICKLALDNYHEMSHKVTSLWYLTRKRIDSLLGKLNGKYFQWIPLYTMVSFRDDIRYSQAIEIEKRQGRFLNNIQYGFLSAVAVTSLIKGLQMWGRRT
ncbi:FAD/NAD(P)-binding domain-containing protein [Suhomyces tanzawaensis NRRL Y-17324]|uniref:Kynurenine 3-monooxygenase n=1 Tax=Suhomyces tanzawaensis NRRL Y-17324 TaxID=984487 RepID=A0A1E4SPP3_9ASCO|nr:FAD/NAD(P)-binding domain-containing protein [Suhomyces tanzawaensis NRRL Y-17324]ODV81466.1 FAD/NAD(P)-binding domain-containing protein [Suhomyces tanzawaensis NRRL Y-17324]